MNGIDVSGWQPANITQLVEYDFAIIKATEGTSFVSPHCAAQFGYAKQRGKLVGLYHFASGLDAVDEANFFVNAVEQYLGEAVLVLDWEGYAISRGREWVRAFVRRVKELTGVSPMIYGSASPLSTARLVEVASEEGCALWVAAYPNREATGYREEPQLLGSAIRQYSSTGRLEGYNGNLDLNVSVLTPDGWKEIAAGIRKAPAPEKPALKTNDEISREVISGQWGQGEERRNRLMAAGYDYSAIQSIVNARLGGEASIVKTAEDIANEVIGGLWGVGQDREDRLTAAGFDTGAIQALVNKKLGVNPPPRSEYIPIPSGPAGYLGNLASRFGTTVEQLVSWNKAKYPSMSANYVQAGWVIRVR